MVHWHDSCMLAEDANQRMNLMKTFALFAALAATAALAVAQAPSPDATTSVTIGGKVLSIKYSAPSVRKRQIFGPGGLISGDPNYPVWRAGANSATVFHTDADLMIGSLSVPKGDYTIYALVEDPNHWQLIINKQTGQWGLTYDASQDLGRVKMTMSVPPSPIEVYKMTLTARGPKSATLRLEWEKHIATASIIVK
jgi:hypothetical protein